MVDLRRRAFLPSGPPRTGLPRRPPKRRPPWPTHAAAWCSQPTRPPPAPSLYLARARILRSTPCSHPAVETGSRAAGAGGGAAPPLGGTAREQRPPRAADGGLAGAAASGRCRTGILGNGGAASREGGGRPEARRTPAMRCLKGMEATWKALTKSGWPLPPHASSFSNAAFDLVYLGQGERNLGNLLNKFRD